MSIKKMRLPIYVLLISLFMWSNTEAKSKTSIQKLEPTSWWVGMKNPNLQLLVYGKDISKYDVRIEYPGVQLKTVVTVENPNYLFVNLVIGEQAKPGEFNIEFLKGKKVACNYKYQLNAREDGSADRKGFDSGDAMYLLMPDRFANGNPANDNIKEMLESHARTEPYGRHGGDLQGIMDHLDYIQDLGLTALWLNPVLENNQPEASYHGYAITDFYKIDARLGTNEDFKNLTQACKERGIKMIMDMVFNHCGSHHWWMNDLPSSDWLNQWEEGYVQTNYRLSTVSDPNASQSDLDRTTKGWFVESMPDLNLRNQFMLNYLIQNSIWWIEYAGLQGIRMDTYPYPDKMGMQTWVKRVMNEYPNFNIVGETWITEPSKLSYWLKDANNRDGYNSHLPSLFDFPIQDALRKALTEEEGWTSGMMRLYNVLADDHLYSNPMNMVVFPDNHDDGRIYEHLGKDLKKLKMALAYSITTRGALQLYYGTEILMDGDGWKGHSHIRQDFPGGWEGDTVNAFTAKGRTAEQKEVYNHTKNLLHFRQNSEAIKYGKTVHFLPENGVYVYFRYTEDEAVMVILNNSKKKQVFEGLRFAEVLKNYNSGLNIITKHKLANLSKFTINAQSAQVIQLKR